MTRSLRSTIRLPGSFGGFAKHMDDAEIGPVRCRDCENVLLRPGRIVKRFGMEQVPSGGSYIIDARTWGICGGLAGPVDDYKVQVITINGSPTGGTWTLEYFGQTTGTLTKDSNAAQVKAALEAIVTFDTQLAVTGPGGGPFECTWSGDRPTISLIIGDGSALTGDGDESISVTGTRSTAAAEELMLVKTTKDTTHTFGEYYAWTAGYGWAPLTSHARWDEAIKEKIATFVPVGLRGADYTGKTYILDGSPNAHKVRMKELGALFQIGMEAPVITGSSTPAGSYPSGTYEWKISVCDRSEIVVENEAFPPPPGLESNASNSQTQASGGAAAIQLNFTAPDIDKQYWTHARIYRKESGANEVTYKLLGVFGRTAALTHPNDDGTLGGSGPYTATLSCAADQPLDTTASGNGAYDYAPTRNHVPQNMRYFAAYHGRGFWAKDDSPYVWYSDDVSVTDGGHYEALSTEMLDPLDGPVTMLANFLDFLIISTPFSLYVLQGSISSLTNKAAANDQNIPPMGARLEKVPGNLGAVIGGTGAHLEIDRNLYFITRDGLARFNGVAVENVSEPIQSLLPLSDTASELQTAQLAHDPVNGVIYMLVNEYLGDDAPEYGRIRGTIWCYHYRMLDETGIGQWTRITDIAAGSTTVTDEGWRWQCYDSITMRMPIGGKPRLVVGVRISDWDNDDDYLIHATLFSEDPDHFRDEARDATPANYDIPWFWQSGKWDAGLPDRQKELWFLLTKITRDAGSSAATLDVSFQVDAGAEITGSHKENSARIETPIRRLGDDIAVKFSGDSQVATEIQGYALDAEPVGDY